MFGIYNMVNEYYQKHKERLQKEAYGRYQNIFEEEKDKRQKNPKTDRKTFLNIKIKNYLST